LVSSVIGALMLVPTWLVPHEQNIHPI